MREFLNRPLLNTRYHDLWWLRELRRNFAREHYVRLPDLLTQNVFAKLHIEINRVEQFGLKKSYRSKGTDTPRIMTALGGGRLLEHSPILTMLYIHHELWTLVQEIVDGPLYPPLHDQELIGVNYLLGVGDTHGWHLDDNAFTLMIIMEAPPEDQGGEVQCIPDWAYHAQVLGYAEGEPLAPYVEQCYTKNLVRTYYHAPGEAYLLRADKTLHSVRGLTQEGARRVVIGFAYENTPYPRTTDWVTGLYEESTTQSINH